MAVTPVIPSPDPSTLTTEQLRHELGLLQEIIETRLDAYDKANVILSENVNRVPTLLDREILRITQLFDQKFSSATNETTALKEMIAIQNTANAIAIGKSEASTAKEIDNIKLILANSAKTIDDKIADMRTNRRLDVGSIVGIVLGIAGVISLVVTLITFAMRAKGG